MYRAFIANNTLPSVLWIVHLDPRGASSIIYRCKQARLAHADHDGGAEMRE